MFLFEESQETYWINSVGRGMTDIPVSSERQVLVVRGYP